MGHPQVAPPRAPGSSISAQTATGGGLEWTGMDGWAAGGGILGWGGGWDLLRDPRKAGGDTGGTLSVTRMHWEALGVTGTYWKTLGMLEGHSG